MFSFNALKSKICFSLKISQSKIYEECNTFVIMRFQNSCIYRIFTASYFCQNFKIIILKYILSFQIKVPQKCFPSYALENNFSLLEPDNTQNQACLHEGRFYQEEAQWTSTSDPCTMCYCQGGNAKCDTTTCPELNCEDSTTTKVKIPGECCPVCTSSKTAQESNKSVLKGCTFGGKFYTAGSKFYPFLMPNGFDFCTECYCDPNLLDIKCTRVGDEKKCCNTKCNKQIPFDSENGTYVNDNGEIDVQQQYSHTTQKPIRTNLNNNHNTSKKIAEQILKEGGCKNVYNPLYPYKNGSKYHPYIASLGEYKCVTCKCEVSTTKQIKHIFLSN